MVKFRRKRMGKRGSFKGFFKRRSKRSGSSSGVNIFQPSAMIYGAIRSPISQLTAKYLPLPVIGTVTDELVMGGINYLVAKNTSGMLKDIAMKGLTIENARLGEAIAEMTGLSGAISGSTTGSAQYVYG